MNLPLSMKSQWGISFGLRFFRRFFRISINNTRISLIKNTAAAKNAAIVSKSTGSIFNLTVVW